MSSLKISQETFDEAVNENMNDFDMTKEDAIIEAVQQFKSQGIDLSFVEIVNDGSSKQYFDTLDKLPDSLSPFDEIATIGSYIDNILLNCQESNSMYKRNCNMLLVKGGLARLIDYVVMIDDENVLVNILTVIRTAAKLDGKMLLNISNVPSYFPHRCIFQLNVAITWI